MDLSHFTHKETEEFELILCSEQHNVSATELINLLASSQNLFSRINVSLNKKSCSGYDFVDLEIVAFKEGSFKIPVVVKKFSMELTVGFLSQFFIALLMQNCNTQVVEIDPDIVTVEEMMSDISTKRSVANIAKTVVLSDSITSLSIQYKKADGNQELVNINKEELKPLSELNTEEQPEVNVTVSTELLTIVSPVLEEKRVQWKFKTQTGRSISATMDDEAFLFKMKEDHITFGSKDVLRVELVTTETVSKDETRYSYRIRKVLQHPGSNGHSEEHQTTIEF